ncbi:MAG TPA: iron-containing alcohol dehydrogenase, partial [Polyangia bacterium]
DGIDGFSHALVVYRMHESSFDAARDLGDEMAGEAAAQAVAQLSTRVQLPPRLRDVGVPEGDLDACAEGSLSDGAIVYNGKFAADKDLVLGVYRNAY